MNDEQTKARDAQAQGRGKLKIFLGAVPGVGKTYRMLAEAQRRVSRGEDIVVGLIEPHGRPATAELIEGLEQLPLKYVEYRGKTFYELNTAAVIDRRPEWVLIDELAHTNIPGTVHEKRWQSIEEIRDAGINVITTLNVQHLESLNDAVYEITGVRVRETVPDWVVDSADEIELVDLTPDAVINRLKRGDIYKGESISQAPWRTSSSKGNIVALRELALRQTAEEVDDQLQVLVPTPTAAPVKAARDRVVVCVSPRDVSFKLVRRGYRLARRMQGDFVCLHVRSPERTADDKEEALLQGDLRPRPNPRRRDRRAPRGFHRRADHQVRQREPDYDDRDGAVCGEQVGGDSPRFAGHPPDARDEEHRHRRGR